MNHNTSVIAIDQPPDGKGYWFKCYQDEILDTPWLNRKPEWTAAFITLLAEGGRNGGVVNLRNSQARQWFQTKRQWQIFIEKITHLGYGGVETTYIEGTSGRTSVLTFYHWEHRQTLKKDVLITCQPRTNFTASETAQSDTSRANDVPTLSLKGGVNEDSHTSLKVFKREREIRERKNSSSSGDDAALFKEGSLAYLLEQLMQTYNAHRGALPAATTLGVHQRMHKGKKTRWGYLEDHLREYGSFERAKKILADATQECSQDDWYISNRYGLITVLRHAQERAEARDAAVSGKPTIEKGVWWRVLWPDSDGIEREQPALVKERVSDELFSVAIITNEHIRTYEEGQKFTKVTTLGEAKFITPYGGTPPCVERVKADEKAKKATRSTTPQGVAHAGD